MQLAEPCPHASQQPQLVTAMRAGGAKRRKLGLSMLAGGVRVVGDDEETARAPEMQRLLRQPRCRHLPLLCHMSRS
jgi:hypothetical protein